MKVPILKQGDCLIASIQNTLNDEDLLWLKDELAQRVGRLRSKGVILDVTSLDVIDSFATRTIRNISDMTRLRGAEMIVVGIQPDVAFAMVQMGLKLSGAETALDLEEGFELLRQKASEKVDDAD
jgi:rsbT antagonist protein RsbS